jgi:hypothetical protein
MDLKLPLGNCYLLSVIEKFYKRLKIKTLD